MSKSWKVVRVLATEEATVTELHEEEWSKVNPAWAEAMAEFDRDVATLGERGADVKHKDDDWVEEFIDAEPDEEDAISSPTGGFLTLINTELDLAPGDSLRLFFE